MARIRTVKPDFWEDETIGGLTRAARLLFIATWNLADDEGILRWTMDYLKANVFMYDEDIGDAEIAALVAELEEAGLVWPYRGGKAQQRLAYIINFRKHQKINRPQAGRFPFPSLQNPQTVLMYARRDGFRCHICGEPTNLQVEPQAFYDGFAGETNPTPFNPSPDHLVPRVDGGSDAPSNIGTAHLRCNQTRGRKTLDSLNRSLPGSMLDSLPEWKGMEAADEATRGTLDVASMSEARRKLRGAS